MAKRVDHLDRHALLTQFDRELRQDLTIPDTRKDFLPWGVRFVRPAPGMSFILFHHLDESSADTAIVEQVEYFHTINLPFDWTVYDHDSPADMKERLAAHGFAADEPAALMVLDLEKLPDALIEPTRLDIRQITHREQLVDVIQVLEQVWGGSFAWVTDRMGGYLVIPGYLNIYVAYIEDQPASVGWVYYQLDSHSIQDSHFAQGSQFAQLFGGSTVPEQRGRGLYTAILARRAQESLRRGVRFLTVEASSMSQPILEKNGFFRLDIAQDFTAPARK
jgi:hypothetical protein